MYILTFDHVHLSVRSCTSWGVIMYIFKHNHVHLRTRSYTSSKTKMYVFKTECAFLEKKLGEDIMVFYNLPKIVLLD